MKMPPALIREAGHPGTDHSYLNASRLLIAVHQTVCTRKPPLRLANGSNNGRDTKCQKVIVLFRTGAGRNRWGVSANRSLAN